MDDESKRFGALYLTRSAGGFGFVTLATCLPKCVTVLDASDFMAGLFYAEFTIAQTAASSAILAPQGGPEVLGASCRLR